MRNAMRVILVAATLALLVTASSPADVALGQAGPQRLTDLQIGAMQRVVDQNRDVFGGLAGDPALHQVTIDVAPSASAVRRSAALTAIQGIASSAGDVSSDRPQKWTVRFSAHGPSLRDLDDVIAALETDSQIRLDLGADLVSYGIDPNRHAVVVGAEHITPVVQKDAAAFRGRLVLITADRSRSLNRNLDSLPYWGGDRLTDTSTFNCTGGFEAKDPGDSNQVGMLTAGHCGRTQNLRVYQGYCDSSCHTTGSMGLVTHHSFGNSQIDGEFLDSGDVGTTLQPYVYTSYGQGAPVHVLGSSFAGLSVCFDGSYTGQNCSGVVQNTMQCVVVQDGNNLVTVCHLTIVASNNGTRMCQGGDSGGPVYQGAVSLTAYGLVESGNPSGTQCNYTELSDLLFTYALQMVLT